MKATVVIGSTYPVNISYPEDKNLISLISVWIRVFSIRLTMDGFVDRYNDCTMEMSRMMSKSSKSVRKALGNPLLLRELYPSTMQDCPTCPPGTTITPAVAPGSVVMMPQQWNQPPVIAEKPKKPKVGFKQEVKNL